jgi:hypothetical protein
VWGAGYRLSDNQHPSTSIEHQASSIKQQTTYIPHPTTHTPQPTRIKTMPEANFQSVQTGRLPDQLLETAPVGKTIMIGLGGTGKEVLLRLRRLIVERFGQLDALPCIQFLHLDTDNTTTARHQYDRAAKDDPLYEKIKFQPSERVGLSIKGGISKYLANINAYPHIKEWFHTRGKIADLGDLGEGAGQIRMASRLGFYDNYNEIESGLSQAERRLGSEKNRDIISRLGFSFDPNTMNIYVVASLAGGTGGGAFLDMGFLIKTMFPDSTRIGVFFMPSFFAAYPGAGRMKANGYAAIRELNHYSFGHSFIGNWTGREEKTVFPPPFDYTYLLEGKNEANEAIGSASEEYSMYQMVAETVFQEFSLGEFAGFKRAIRVNLKNFIDNAYVHNYWEAGTGVGIQAGQGTIKGDSYTTRFCSLGLGVIAFPVEKVHRACACRLAQNILDLWQQNVVEDPLEVLFTSFLTHPDIEFVQGEYTRRDGGGTISRRDAEDALLMYNREAGQTFQSYIWNKVIEIRRDVELKPYRQKAAALANHRDQWEQLMAKADSDNPDEWGMDIRIIQANMDKYLAKLEKGIEAQADKLANDPRYGISYALSVLRELKKLLRNEHFKYVPYFEDSVGYWNDSTQDHLDDLEQLQLEIAHHERRFLFRNADLERDMRILAPKDHRGEGVLYDYFLSRVMKQVAKRGKQVCERIDKFLGGDSADGKGLLAKYHQLTSGLDQLKTRLQDKEAYFSRKEEYATLKSLYRQGDITEWYQVWMGDPEEQKKNLRQVSDRLLSKIFGVSSVTEALNYIQQRSVEAVEDQVLEECRIFFATREVQPSALEMLMDERRCSRRERDNLIETAYARAKVWMKATHKADQVQFRVTNQQKPCIIGVDANDAVRFGEFRNILTGRMAPGDTQPQFKNIGESKKSAIVFYNELGGATAFYPSSVTEVGGLKQNYDEFCRNPKDVSPDNQEDVHIDKNRFQFADIIPKTSDEVRKYSDSVRAFALARLLGVLKVEEIRGDDPFTVINRYSYEQEVAFDMVEEDLGDEFAAVDILYQDPRSEYESHRKILYDQAEEVVDKLRSRRLLSVYLLMIEFYLTHVYPPVTEDSGIAGVQLRRYSPFYAALDAERTRVDKQLIPSQEEREKVQTALTKLRGGKAKGQKLTYEEYVSALQPYTKMAGKFEMTARGAIGVKRVFLDVPVLDRKKAQVAGDRAQVAGDRAQGTGRRSQVTVDGSQVSEVIPAAVSASESPGTRSKRPCPECGNPIDVRAIFCIHCGKMIAKHITCQHCGESKVPDDLTECWNCGREPRKLEKKMECTRCYSFEGFRSEFPCPICGWDPGEEADMPESAESPEIQYAEPAEEEETGVEPKELLRDDIFEQPEQEPLKPDAAEPVEQKELLRDDMFEQPEDKADDLKIEEQSREPVQEESASEDTQIECPHCGEMVDRGARCSICGESL